VVNKIITHYGRKISQGGKEEKKINKIGQVKTICQEICLLGECPNWNARQLKLYWTDIEKSCLWMYDYTRQTSEIFWKGSCRVGGFAFTKKNDIVLCSDKGVYILEKQRDYLNPPKLLFAMPFKEKEMFNDIIVDPMGRIIAGTLDKKDHDGRLYQGDRATGLPDGIDHRHRGLRLVSFLGKPYHQRF